MDRVGKLGAVAGGHVAVAVGGDASGCRRPSRAAPTASSAPSAGRTSRWWSRGGRGSRPPVGRCGTAPHRASLALLVSTTPPPESSREIPAPAGRPVTYTCSTLPRALKVAALALLAKTSARAAPARKREIPRQTGRAASDTLRPPFESIRLYCAPDCRRDCPHIPRRRRWKTTAQVYWTSAAGAEIRPSDSPNSSAQRAVLRTWTAPSG